MFKHRKTLCILLIVLLLLVCCFFLFVRSCKTEQPGSTEQSSSTDRSDHPETDEMSAGGTQAETGEDTQAETQAETERAISLRAFLTDLNLNGSLLVETDEQPDAPGTPLDPACVPQCDRSEVCGSTYTISLSYPGQTHSFFYSRSTDGGEYLTVLVPAKIPLLLRFSVDVGGAQQLYQLVQDGACFKATLLAAANVAPDEQQYLGVAFSSLNSQRAPVSGSDDIPADLTYFAGLSGQGGTQFWALSGFEALRYRYENMMKNYMA